MPRRNDYHSPRREDGWRGAHRDESHRYGYGDDGHRYRDDRHRYGDDGWNDGRRVARKGDRLQIHYTCFDEDGKKLESTHDGGPAPTITLGGGDVLKALEKAFTGMAAGERKTVTLERGDTLIEFQ